MGELATAGGLRKDLSANEKAPIPLSPCVPYPRTCGPRLPRNNAPWCIRRISRPIRRARPDVRSTIDASGQQGVTSHEEQRLVDQRELAGRRQFGRGDHRHQSARHRLDHAHRFDVGNRTMHEQIARTQQIRAYRRACGIRISALRASKRPARNLNTA